MMVMNVNSTAMQLQMNFFMTWHTVWSTVCHGHITESCDRPPPSVQSGATNHQAEACIVELISCWVEESEKETWIAWHVQCGRLLCCNR